MAPTNPHSSGLNHAVEQAGALLCDEAGSIASQQSASPPKGQNQAFKALAVIRSLLGTRWIVGGVLGPSSLYLLSKLPDGFLWGPIEVLDVGPGFLLALGSFAGSLVFGGAVWVAGVIAPTPRYYLSVLEAWLMYRMGCIPPAVYFEHVAKLHAARLKGHLPAAAPTKRDATVLRTLRWRMDSDAKHVAKPKRKRKRKKMKKHMGGMGT